MATSLVMVRQLRPSSFKVHYLLQKWGAFSYCVLWRYFMNDGRARSR
jgi:hypothetical protein